MKNEIQIAGSLTVQDWVDLKQKLDCSSNENWESAFAFFQQRITTRYLIPIKAILVLKLNTGEGFSVVNLQCSLIETIECFYNGWLYRKEKTEKKLNGFYDRTISGAPKKEFGNQDIFINFFRERSPFKELKKIDGEDFYINIRCGLLHETQTKNGWVINEDKTHHLIYDEVGENKIIYRSNFQKALEKIIDDYKNLIINGGETNKIYRENFVAKFDHICLTSITNNRSVISDEQKFISFFQRHPNSFINIVSKHYSLNEIMIERYNDKLNWEELSDNSSLPWSIELIEKYKAKWDWLSLSRNKNLPWTEELIEKFNENWIWDSWSGLSNNENLPWSLDLIKKFESNWNWSGEHNFGGSRPVKYGLSINKNLPWSIGLIEQYIDKWNWDDLSENSNLPWSSELIEKYHDKWNWYYLSENPNLPWSTDFIEKYKNNWNWNGLSGNPNLPWSMEFFEKYIDKWNWYNLSENINLPWSNAFFEKYIEKWENWYGISSNQNLPWTSKFIEEHLHKWQWSSLCENPNLPWSIEFIERYKNELSWYNLSQNHGLPWSDELIEKYKNEWRWDCLGYSSNLPWSIDLIEKYNDKWNFDHINSNDIIWKNVFEKQTNNVILEKLFKIA